MWHWQRSSDRLHLSRPYRRKELRRIDISQMHVSKKYLYTRVHMVTRIGYLYHVRPLSAVVWIPLRPSLGTGSWKKDNEGVRDLKPYPLYLMRKLPSSPEQSLFPF